MASARRALTGAMELKPAISGWITEIAENRSVFEVFCAVFV
jgi:hypothetical protein